MTKPEVKRIVTSGLKWRLISNNSEKLAQPNSTQVVALFREDFADLVEVPPGWWRLCSENEFLEVDPGRLGPVSPRRKTVVSGSMSLPGMSSLLSPGPAAPAGAMAYLKMGLVITS